jgi:FkbM family methyltransferase
MIPSWLKGLFRSSGFDAVRHSDDPLLQDMLSAHREFRTCPDDPLLWEERLSQLAAASHLRNLLNARAIDLVIDVGANVGQFAGRLRRLGYDGEIVSFEPLGTARSVLEAAAAGDAKWVVRPEALGRSRSRAVLHGYADSTFSSLREINDLGRSRFGSLLESTESESVEILPLDSLLGDVAGSGPRRILLKTDTQGFDLEVLAGAVETLKSAEVVLAEASTMPIYKDAARLPELLLEMERRGFTPSGLFPIGHDSPPSLALIELDCYFVRIPPKS